MEIIQERIRREYGLDILSTYPAWCGVFRLEVKWSSRCCLLPGPQVKLDPQCSDP